MDNSKSSKNVLMQLFAKYGNYDINVASINEDYGTTNALVNTINWVQSNSWDGRYGIIVAADIYSKCSVSPTGGAGAIAILIGPNANLIFEDVISTFKDHEDEFNKPLGNSIPFIKIFIK